MNNLSEEDLESLRQRIAVLETQVRFLKRTIVALALLCGIMLFGDFLAPVLFGVAKAILLVAAILIALLIAAWTWRVRHQVAAIVDQSDEASSQPSESAK